MTSGQPLVGIVLVNFNGKRFLNECLRSLRSLDYPRTSIVVVDNASTDGSTEALVAEFPEVPVLRQAANLGVAAGNNVGIRHCLQHGCDFILLLNYDTVVGEALVRELVRVADARTLVTGKSYAWDRSGTINSHVGGFDWLRGRVQEWFCGQSDGPATRGTQEVELADTSCLLVPRQAFADVGLMDEAFFLYYDDTDFVVRARRAGYRVLFHPEAVYWHHERGSSGPLDLSPVAVYFTNRNRVYFMRKHAPARVHYLIFWGYFAITRLACALRYAARGRWGHVAWMLRGVRDFWYGRTGGVAGLGPRSADPSSGRTGSA